jgi:hypothetical protein
MSAATEKRFWLLRRLSKVMSVGAWIVLVIVLLVTPVGFARAIIAGAPDEFMQWLGYAVSGIALFVWLLYNAQLIQVILALEENTKQTAYVLEKLTTLTQQVRDRLGETADRREPGDQVEPPRIP